MYAEKCLWHPLEFSLLSITFYETADLVILNNHVAHVIYFEISWVLWLRQQPTNCLSVFNHFVGLALKGLNTESLFSVMMMSYFCEMIDRRKSWGLISRQDYCQRFSPSWITDMSCTAFEHAQYLSSDFFQ